MITPWYITGYCESSALFTYSRSGGTYTIFFSIKHNEGNNQLLEDIQIFFGYIGTVYTHKPSSVFRVNKIEELKRITDHFDKYPLQDKKKLASYGIWRQMVEHKLENYRDVEYAKLKNLADRLSNLNSHNRMLLRRERERITLPSRIAHTA